MPKIVQKEIDKKKSIGQVSKELGVQTHVIRFWETKFDQIKPVIGKGERRYFFKEDIEILKKIKYYLYEEGYTIAGLQKLFSSKNSKLDKAINSNISDKSQTFSSSDLSKSQKEEIQNLISNIENKIQEFEELVK